MHFQRTTIFLALIFGLFLTAPAMGSNVLLPDDATSGGQQPNLGLMPTTDTVAPQSAAPEPDPSPTPAAQQPAAAVPALPTTATPPQTTPAKPTTPTTKIAPPYQAPPKPYKITVSLTNPPWTARDIKAVSAELGLSAQSVADHCRMGFLGTVITNKGAEHVDSKGAATTEVAYNGSIDSGAMTLYAACNQAPRPAKGHYIMRVTPTTWGVPLKNVHCMASKNSAGTLRTLVLTHSTKGSDSCAFSR